MPPKKSAPPKIGNPVTRKGKSRAVAAPKATQNDSPNEQTTTRARSTRNAIPPATSSTQTHPSPTEPSSEVPLAVKPKNSSAGHKKAVANLQPSPPADSLPPRPAKKKLVRKNRTDPNDLFSDDDELPVSKKRRVAVRDESISPSARPSSSSSLPVESSPLSTPPSSPPPRRGKPPTFYTHVEMMDGSIVPAEDVEDAAAEDEGDAAVEGHARDDEQLEEVPNEGMDDDAEAEAEDELGDDEDEVIDGLCQFEDPQAAAKAIKDALVNPKVLESATYLRPYQRLARYIPRMINPFSAITPTLETALILDFDVEFSQQDLGLPELKSLNKEIYGEYKAFYQATTSRFPILLKAMHALCDDAGTFEELCKFMDFHLRAARREDTGRLRGFILTYVPELKTTQGIRKGDRGWHNRVTARLLCPQDRLREFDEDWELFAQNTKRANPPITAFDSPSFLWDQEEAAKGSNWKDGLLQGPLLLTCFRSIFTGPRTAQNPEPGLLPGKSCFMQAYSVDCVVPFMIGYAAALTRFALHSHDRLKREQEHFNYPAFIKSIQLLFEPHHTDKEAKKWANNTIAWWNLQVLGTKKTEAREPAKESLWSRIMSETIPKDA